MYTIAANVIASVTRPMVQTLLLSSPAYSRICWGKYVSLRLFFTTAPGIRHSFRIRIGIHCGTPRVVVRRRPAQCKQHYVSVERLPRNRLVKAPIEGLNREAL